MTRGTFRQLRAREAAVAIFTALGGQLDCSKMTSTFESCRCEARVLGRNILSLLEVSPVSVVTSESESCSAP